MSETTSPADLSGNSSILNFGGMLGVAACFVGLAIFLGGCMGFERSFDLALVPLAMAGVGLVMTILGGMRRTIEVEHTPVLAGLRFYVFRLIGAMIQSALAHRSAPLPHT